MSPADEHPFLEAILSREHDDGPRLVYADYLEESGNPADAARAELIRVQVALARLPDDDEQCPELAERQADLLTAHLGGWSAPLAKFGVEVEFRRGIADSIAVDAGTFLNVAEQLFHATRVGNRSQIRRVRLIEPARVLPQLIGCRHLAEIEELVLCNGGLGNAGVSLLVQSPHLGTVRLLDLGFNGIDDTGVRTLARSSTLPRLQALYLPTWLNDTRRITWDGVCAIAESPFLAGLVELDLSGNAVNDAGVRAIAKSGSLVRLQLLRLQQNLIGDGGVAALVRSDLLRRMLKRDPRLDLRDNAIGAAGVAALAASPDLQHAERLDLRRNYLGDRGATLLAISANISGLRSLLLGRNQIGDVGALALAKALERNPNLRSLDISGNRLTRRGVEALRTAARDRVAADFSSNGTEPSTPLPASLVPAPPVADDPNLAELKRRVTHPTRRER